MASVEMAELIAENMMGFVRVLAEWDAKEILSYSAADEELTTAPESNDADGN